MVEINGIREIPKMTNLQKLKGTNVLVTGGLGFIGSNLAIKLTNLGANVTILDSLDKNCGGNIYNITEVKNSIKLEIMDMRQQSKLRTFVRNKEFIFNLAGQVSHTRSITDPNSDLNNNLSAHLSLLEACRKNNPDVTIVYTGSRSQYGKPIYLPVDEDHPMNPTDINGINKMAAEKYHILYNSLHGINVCALRLTNIYGHRHQMKNGYGFVNWFVRKAIENSEIKIFGQGEALRDVLYVGDAVDAIIGSSLSKKSKGKIYNVGSGKSIQVHEIAKEIVKVCRSGKIEFAKFPEDFKKIEIGNFYSNISKIKSDIGWKPKTSFQNGITKTIEFYNKNKKHYW